MTKIRFKRNKIYPNLILGVVWLIIGVLNFTFSNELSFLRYFWFAIGLLYLSNFIYDWKNQYLKIDNQTIQKNFLYGGWNKKLRLDDIYLIEKTYLNYTLKTNSDSLEVNADLIEDKSYKQLKVILSGLNLPEDKKPALL